MTREEFIDKLMAEYEKNEQIKLLIAQREAEEKKLYIEYKVNECNSKRNAIIVKYNNQIKVIRDN